MEPIAEDLTLFRLVWFSDGIFYVSSKLNKHKKTKKQLLSTIEHVGLKNLIKFLW